MNRILVNPQFAYKLNCYILFIDVNFLKCIFVCVFEVIILKARFIYFILFFFHKAKCFCQHGVPFRVLLNTDGIFQFQNKRKAGYIYLHIYVLVKIFIHTYKCLWIASVCTLANRMEQLFWSSCCQEGYRIFASFRQIQWKLCTDSVLQNTDEFEKQEISVDLAF